VVAVGAVDGRQRLCRGLPPRPQHVGAAELQGSAGEEYRDCVSLTFGSIREWDEWLGAD
jgi:hypothetical protein